MHEVAELGVAAHWALQAGRAASPRARSIRWIRELLDILDTCSEPGGIPRAHQARDVPGSGVLLHAQGRPDRAAAGRHAGRLRLCGPQRRSAIPASAPRSTAACCRSAPSLERRPGRDLHSQGSAPSPTWERFVVTGKARARIRRFIRTQQRAQYIGARQALLAEALPPGRLRIHRKGRGRCHQVFQASSVEDLFASVGAARNRPARSAIPSSRP